ncbi:hypothetical protein VNO77_27260 [Canavalia gladiata]|uniref:Uncharacterized protein n=1 Tax=Canavalia gladiata TaxID=3824 RepID=A0AAN9KXJ1_CANGL
MKVRTRKLHLDDSGRTLRSMTQKERSVGMKWEEGEGFMTRAFLCFQNERRLAVHATQLDLNNSCGIILAREKWGYADLCIYSCVVDFWTQMEEAKNRPSYELLPMKQDANSAIVS